MKRVLLSGEMERDSGPSLVNQGYASVCGDWLDVAAPRPSWSVVRHLWRERGRYSAVMVSSLSGYHVVLLLLARGLRIEGVYLAHAVGRTERRINQPPGAWKPALVEGMTVRLATRVVAVSPHLATGMRASFPRHTKKITSVLIGVDTRTDVGTTWVPTTPSGRVRVMTVGTAPIKNLRTLIDAVGRVDEQAVELVVVGPLPHDLPERPSRITLIQYDRLPREAVRAWMSTSSIYAQVSLEESFGLAICEAAQEGCALLLSSNVGALAALDGLSAVNVVHDPTDVADVTAHLNALIAAVRAKVPSRINCNRTWDDAGTALRRELAR